MIEFVFSANSVELNNSNHIYLTKFCELSSVPVRQIFICALELPVQFEYDCVQPGNIRVWAGTTLHNGTAMVQCNSTLEMELEVVYENGEPDWNNSRILDQRYFKHGIKIYWDSGQQTAAKYIIRTNTGLQINFFFLVYKYEGKNSIVEFQVLWPKT